jgi:hypothetical protein
MKREWIAIMALAGAVLAGCGSTEVPPDAEALGADSSALWTPCEIGDESCESKQGTTCYLTVPTGYCCDTWGGGRQTCKCLKTGAFTGDWMCPL